MGKTLPVAADVNKKIVYLGLLTLRVFGSELFDWIGLTYSCENGDTGLSRSENDTERET